MQCLKGKKNLEKNKNMDMFYGTNAIKFLENIVMIPKEHGCVHGCKTTYIP
jgi:hypothetical protein